jgi:hypothetical protein
MPASQADQEPPCRRGENCWCGSAFSERIGGREEDDAPVAFGGKRAQIADVGSETRTVFTRELDSVFLEILAACGCALTG